MSVDDKPISIKSCHVDIAHGYTKKKHVFKLITLTGSEYLLQAEDHKDMVSWIKAIDDLRNPDKEVCFPYSDWMTLIFLSGSHLPTTTYSHVELLFILLIYYYLLSVFLCMYISWLI